MHTKHVFNLTSRVYFWIHSHGFSSEVIKKVSEARVLYETKGPFLQKQGHFHLFGWKFSTIPAYISHPVLFLGVLCTTEDCISRDVKTYTGRVRHHNSILWLQPHLQLYNTNPIIWFVTLKYFSLVAPLLNMLLLTVTLCPLNHCLNWAGGGEP